MLFHEFVLLLRKKKAGTGAGWSFLASFAVGSVVGTVEGLELTLSSTFSGAAVTVVGSTQVSYFLCFSVRVMLSSSFLLIVCAVLGSYLLSSSLFVFILGSYLLSSLLFCVYIRKLWRWQQPSWQHWQKPGGPELRQILSSKPWLPKRRARPISSEAGSRKKKRSIVVSSFFFLLSLSSPKLPPRMSPKAERKDSSAVAPVPGSPSKARKEYEDDFLVLFSFDWLLQDRRRNSAKRRLWPRCHRRPPRLAKSKEERKKMKKKKESSCSVFSTGGPPSSPPTGRINSPRFKARPVPAPVVRDCILLIECLTDPTPLAMTFAQG